MHAAADLPLRQTVALVAEAGGPSLSPMRLHKKMIRASEYLHLLVTAMVDTPMGLAPEKLLMHSARSIPNCALPGTYGTALRRSSPCRPYERTCACLYPKLRWLHLLNSERLLWSPE